MIEISKETIEKTMEALRKNQMTPYFNWPGLGECSNNMNSCYNSFHMGYACNNVKNEWAMARTQFFNSDPKAGKVSKMRCGLSGVLYGGSGTLPNHTSQRT